MPTPFEILSQAQDLIRDPAKWTKEAYARNGAGAHCEPTEASAVCFCSIGAIRHVAPTAHENRKQARGYLTRASIEIGRVQIMTFNDHHTHEEVMAMWDRAKELALEAHL